MRRVKSRLPAAHDPRAGTFRGTDQGEARLQQFFGEPAVFAEADAVLHKVLQFAHIAGPCVGLEFLEQAGGDFVTDPPRGTVRLEKELHQKAYVPLPFAQGRDNQRNDVQPVKKILAEAPGFDRVAQVPIAGGDYPHIQLADLAASHAADFIILQGPQHLGLQAERHFARLVQKQGAAVGLFQQTRLTGAVSSGKSPALVAEKNAFRQRLGNGPAVDGHKRLLLTRALHMNGSRHQLLARAGLALHKDDGVHGGDFADLFAQSANGRALPHQLHISVDERHACLLPLDFYHSQFILRSFLFF